MPLTDTYIRSLKAADKEQKHFDGGGLYLSIPKFGRKLWRMAYRFDQETKLLSFGEYATDEMCTHGFRSIASTLLNELGYNRDWIECQLAHGERTDVRAAHNYAEYLPERRKMMQEWANYLTALKEKF